MIVVIINILISLNVNKYTKVFFLRLLEQKRDLCEFDSGFNKTLWNERENESKM